MELIGINFSKLEGEDFFVFKRAFESAGDGKNS